MHVSMYLSIHTYSHTYNLLFLPHQSFYLQSTTWNDTPLHLDSFGSSFSTMITCKSFYSQGISIVICLQPLQMEVNWINYLTFDCTIDYLLSICTWFDRWVLLMTKYCGIIRGNRAKNNLNRMKVLLELNVAKLFVNSPQ